MRGALEEEGWAGTSMLHSPRLVRSNCRKTNMTMRHETTRRSTRRRPCSASFVSSVCPCPCPSSCSCTFTPIAIRFSSSAPLMEGASLLSEDESLFRWLTIVASRVSRCSGQDGGGGESACWSPVCEHARSGPLNMPHGPACLSQRLASILLLLVRWRGSTLLPAQARGAREWASSAPSVSIADHGLEKDGVIER